MQRSRMVVLAALVVFAALCVVLFRIWPFGSESGEDTPLQDRRISIVDSSKVFEDTENDAMSLLGKFPWQRRLATVRGKVTSTDGAPISGARVCLWSEHDLLPGELKSPRCTLSEKDGSYHLGEVPPLAFDLHASAEQYRPGRHVPSGRSRSPSLRPGEVRERVDVVLEAGGVEIRGIVMDSTGGIVDGAEIVAQTWSWGSIRSRGVTWSDAEGKFSMWTAPGSMNVKVQAEGYGGSSAPSKAPGPTIEVYLMPESIIVGRVVRGGEAVSDALVSAGGQTTMSGADGAFRLVGITGGTHRVEARTADGYGRAPRSVVVGLAETSDPIEIELHPATHVYAQVNIETADGAPCPEGSVSLNDLDDMWKSARGQIEDGYVSIGGARPGVYRVSVACEGFIKLDDEIELRGEAEVRVQWIVSPGFAIVGIVRDDRGSPVSEVVVQARSESAGSTATTSSTGAFRVEGLPPGNYEVSVTGNGIVPGKEKLEVELVSEELEVELEVERGGVVEGKVIDELGNPVARVSVRLADRWFGKTLDDGTFRIEGVHPGTHRIVALDGLKELLAAGETEETARATVVEVTSGETSMVEIRVARRDGLLRGRVVDASGGPVPDASIHAVLEAKTDSVGLHSTFPSSWWDAGHRPVVTDIDGGFEVSGLSPGSYTVRALRSGGGEGVQEHAELGSNVVIELSETGSIRGTIDLAGGSFPDEIKVSLANDVAGGRRDDSFYQTEGVFEFDQVVAGEYELSVTTPRGDGSARVQVIAGERADDIVVALVPRVAVQGRAIDLETGEPIEGLQFFIGAKGAGAFGNLGASSFDQRTDADGRFRIDSVPAGPVEALVMNRSAMQSYSAALKLDLPTDTPLVDLGDLEFAATRLEAGQTEGDLGFRLREVPAGTSAHDVPIEVAFVRPGGPAAKAGLKPGSIITSVDGHEVEESKRHLWKTLIRVPVGARVVLGIKGGGTVELVAESP